MRKYLVIALATLSLGACAAKPVYTKPGLTDTEWRADQYACERDARAVFPTYGYSIVDTIEAIHFQRRCLEAKGYVRMQ